MIEVKNDKEMLEILLSIVADSAYAKPIEWLRKDKSHKDIIEMAWQMTLAEEQGYQPVVLTISKHVPYSVGYSRKSPYIAYIPLTNIVNH